jgi:hypothetical protein
MKKSLFFVAAASALMLTACSSENDVVQNAPQTQETVAKALDFDVYLPEAANVTRAGDPVGVMNTEKLKTLNKGFGVFAMYQDGIDYPANNTNLLPNFMFNEHVSWNGGWSYSPLKYWPNETTNDSQDPDAAVMPGPGTPGANLDKLSFFAYAPYVVTGAAPLATKDATTMVIDRDASTKISAYHGSETSGITAISAQDYASDPKVEWAYSADLDQNVDLLWGVAPAGMTYTDVSGGTTSAPTGMPLLDMVKPDKDQKMKFLFQHALSRIGLSVVSAIDQIAAGDDGNKFNNMQTRVLIKSVEVYGDFGKQGVLNLNNGNGTANVANWIAKSILTHTVGGAALFTFDSRQDGSSGNGYIAPDLRYVDSQITGVTSAGSAGAAATAFSALNTGVLPSEQTLLSGDADPDPSKKVTNPTFAYGKVYYVSAGANDKGYKIAKISATAPSDIFIKDEDNYKQVFASGATVSLDGNSPEYYSFTPGTVVAAAATLPAKYYKKTVTDGKATYTLMTTAGTADAADTYYDFNGASDDKKFVGTAYATGDYYTALIPRYFMVIPTGDTNIKVKITYAVVTYDEKLNTYVTNVENDITKATSLTLKSGKSYNLKLILGLTSVKLDATVADWLVADDAEIWLPKNN